MLIIFCYVFVVDTFQIHFDVNVSAWFCGWNIEQKAVSIFRKTKLILKGGKIKILKS